MEKMELSYIVSLMGATENQQFKDNAGNEYDKQRAKIKGTFAYREEKKMDRARMDIKKQAEEFKILLDEVNKKREAEQKIKDEMQNKLNQQISLI